MRVYCVRYDTCACVWVCAGLGIFCVNPTFISAFCFFVLSCLLLLLPHHVVCITVPQALKRSTM